MVTVQGGTLPQSSQLSGQKVQSFQIGRTEVTWDEWQTIRTWAVANGYTDLNFAGGGYVGSHPVHQVSWYSSLQWCNAKSQMEGLTPVYTVNGTIFKTGQFIPNSNPAASGYRLPEEAEWEWAARGGVCSKGYAYSGSDNSNLVAWTFENSTGATVNQYAGRGTWPAGQKATNELGIFDMSGNIGEWCWDEYDDFHRVHRGGSWNELASYSAFRNRDQPDRANSVIGFRLARNIGPKISISGTLPEATLNQAYAGYTFGAVGTTGDKVWSISEGLLPSGMSFSANGTLSGTPTTAGTYTFVIRVESGGYWDEVEVEFKVINSESNSNIIMWGATANPTSVIQVASGLFFGLALKTDGSVFAWGESNEYGQTEVPKNLINVKQVAAGPFHSLALRKDGTVVAWGRNESGQTNVPPDLKDVVQVAGGWNNTIALKEDKTVVVWGSNIYGQRNIPQNVSDVKQVSVGIDHCVALKNDGTVVVWGSNARGQRNIPQNLQNISQIAAGDFFTAALKEDGNLVVWGSANKNLEHENIKFITPSLSSIWAQRGDGSVLAINYGDDLESHFDQISEIYNWWGVNKANPTQIKQLSPDILLYEDGSVVDLRRAILPYGLNNIKQISLSRSFGIALKQDGELVGWGNDMPVPSGLPEVDQIATGHGHAVALKKDGTVVAWGDNWAGQTYIPPDLNGVIKIAATDYATHYLKKDGTIFSSGYNDSGQLNSPPNLLGVRDIAASSSHTLAITKEGNMIAWGGNEYGQLNIPSNLSNVVQIGAGWGFSAALNQSGEVIVWGKLSGFKAENFRNIAALYCGGDNLIALKKDGTLIGCGDNMFSQNNIPENSSGAKVIYCGRDTCVIIK